MQVRLSIQRQELFAYSNNLQVEYSYWFIHDGMMHITIIIHQSTIRIPQASRIPTIIPNRRTGAHSKE